MTIFSELEVETIYGWKKSCQEMDRERGTTRACKTRWRAGRRRRDQKTNLVNPSLLIGAAASIALGLSAIPADAFVYIGGSYVVPIGVKDIALIVTLKNGLSFPVDVNVPGGVKLGTTNLQLLNYTSLFGTNISAVEFVAWTFTPAPAPPEIDKKKKTNPTNPPPIPVIGNPPVPGGPDDAGLFVILADGTAIPIDAAFTPSVQPGVKSLLLINYVAPIGDPALFAQWIDWTNPPPPGPMFAAPVPEPTTWAMMLVGFGGLGAILRARRRPITA